MTRLFTYEDFLNLADDLQHLTGNRVEYFLTSQAVIDRLKVECVSQGKFFRAMTVGGVPILPTKHLPPDMVQAVPEGFGFPDDLT